MSVLAWQHDLTAQSPQHTTIPCFFPWKVLFRFYRVVAELFFRFENPDFLFWAVDQVYEIHVFLKDNLYR